MKWLVPLALFVSAPALAVVSVTMDTTSGHFGCCENSSSDSSCSVSITWVAGEQAAAIVYFYNEFDIVNTISGGASSWSNVYNNAGGMTFTNFYIETGAVVSSATANFSVTGNQGNNNYMAACAFQLQNYGSFNTSNKNYNFSGSVTNPLSVVLGTALKTGGLAIGAIGEGAGSGSYSWTATTGTKLTSPSGTVVISHAIMYNTATTIAANAPFTGTHNNAQIVIEADPPAGRNWTMMGVGQ